MQSNKIVVRDTLETDIEGVVALFCEGGGNPYNWSISKWKHYYHDYPDGKPISLVAEWEGRIVGHYGMLPVRIGLWPAMLGLHAYVASDRRGLAVLSALMRAVDERCQVERVAMICGFANPKFTFIQNRVFKWLTPLWLGFKKDLGAEDIGDRESHPFYFKYSPAWATWRFGFKRATYISRYTDASGCERKQALKTSESTTAQDLNGCEGWSPRLIFAVQQPNQFCQPFSIKVYDKGLLNKGVLDFHNWFVEMGDSDTFQYMRWKDDND